MSKNNYVYIYYVKNKPVYVGIGTDDDGSYERARNIAGHKHVSKKYKPHAIELKIVIRNVSRKWALVTEALLLQQFKMLHFDLLNKQEKTNHEELCLLQVTPAGILTDILRLLPYDKETQKKVNGKYLETDKGKLHLQFKKLYDKSAEGRDYSAMTMKISRYRRQGKNVTTLLEERSNLMSLAQWKTSEEGREALKEITKSNKTKEKERK